MSTGPSIGAAHRYRPVAWAEGGGSAEARVGRAGCAVRISEGEALLFIIPSSARGLFVVTFRPGVNIQSSPISHSTRFSSPWRHLDVEGAALEFAANPVLRSGRQLLFIIFVIAYAVFKQLIPRRDSYA
jgi:hypothetical protein